MYEINEAFKNDEFRQKIRKDINFSSIKHGRTKNYERKITDSMVQLVINQSDFSQKHKKYEHKENVVKYTNEMTRQHQGGKEKAGYFQKVLAMNGFKINNAYVMPSGKKCGLTKAIQVPKELTKMCLDTISRENLFTNVQLNSEIQIHWSNPHKFNGAMVPSRVLINTEKLKQFAEELHKDDKENLYKKWNLQLRIRQAMENQGWMEQVYKVSDYGRLTGLGLSSLQTMPKRLLNQVLQGAVELDVQCSAIRLLADIHNQIVSNPIRFDAIERYIKHRSDIREEVSRAIGADLKDVKTAYLAIQFGAKTNLNSYYVSGEEVLPAIRRTFGSEQKAKQFLEHPEVKSLTDEMKTIFKVISEKNKKKYPKLSVSQRVAMVYQQNEAEMLATMISFAGNQIIVPKHDAIIISSPMTVQEKEELEQLIYNKHGYNIQLEQKILQ